MSWTRLEQQLGVKALLRQVLAYLQRFDGPVANGDRCPECEVYGSGTAKEHAPGCPGVALLQDVREAIGDA